MNYHSCVLVANTHIKGPRVGSLLKNANAKIRQMIRYTISRPTYYRGGHSPRASGITLLFHAATQQPEKGAGGYTGMARVS